MTFDNSIFITEIFIFETKVKFPIVGKDNHMTCDIKIRFFQLEIFFCEVSVMKISIKKVDISVTNVKWVLLNLQMKIFYNNHKNNINTILFKNKTKQI